MIRNRTAILYLLTGLNLLNYLDRYVVAAVLKQMQSADKGLDLSNLEGGLLATVFLLGYFVTSPWFGARADRGKRTGLIALGVGVWSIATVASGFADNFWELLAARVFVGVGEAAYATLAPTIIDDITPVESKGKALAVFYVAAPVGSALGYLCGGMIQAAWGWRTAFFVAGPPGMLLALTCLLIAEPERKLSQAKGNVLAALKKLSNIPIFRRAVLGYCAYTAAVGAFSYWGPKYLAEAFGDPMVGLADAFHLTARHVSIVGGVLTDDNASTYFGAITVVGGALGTLIGGRWADREQRLHPVDASTPWNAVETRRGSNALLKVCAVGMAIAAPFTALAFAMPLPILFFTFAFLAEIGLFLSTSPVNAIGLRSVPPEMRASAMAAMIFAIHLFGDLWSPTVLGFLADELPGAIAMMAVPLVFGVSAWIWRPRRAEAA
nr:MFS transporter [Kofleriaceae bacterium]